MSRLTPELASDFARIALGHVGQEYPHKLDHVMTGPDDIRGPRDLHPVFYGSFDWHSCVHGWWLLLRLLRLFPDLPEVPRIIALADEMLEPMKLGVERAYLDRPSSAGFERPYGWAWALALHGEAARHADRPWAGALRPLADAFADRFRQFLPRLTYPIRTGTHFNTAFALLFALEWSLEHDGDLADLIRRRAVDYFRDDHGCPGWEPGGDEFLSSAMIEALLMRCVLMPSDFADWLAGFLPDLGAGQPRSLFTPATVSDRTDGKIAHLDGFNFCRAWCWSGISDALQPDLARTAGQTAERHLQASLAHVDDHYMGAHWLATFAALALEACTTRA